MIKKLYIALPSILFVIVTFLVLPSPANAQSTVRIMPVGDSITEIGSSYRVELYCKLRKNGFNVDFVGSNRWNGAEAENDGTCYAEGARVQGIQFDKDQEGHSGTLTGYTEGNIDTWMNSSRPDIVLIHLGTNDVLGSPWSHLYDDPWGNIGMYTSYKNILRKIKAANPNARILMAKIIPVDPSAMRSTATVTYQDVNTLIQRIYDEEKNNYNLYLVDMTQAGINAGNAADLYDGIHPASQGGIKMANKWYSVLAPLLSGGPIPTAPPGATVTPTKAVTPTTVPPTPSPVSLPSNAQFYRGINLNGPALTIDGRAWQGQTTSGVTATGGVFENQAVPLVPAASEDMAIMIRSSVWGNSNSPIITIPNVPNGTAYIYLYNWEDNAAATFNVSVQGQVVASNVSSGSSGQWRKLGPYSATVTNGTITVASSGGDANFSGIEVWTAGSTGAVTTAPNAPTATPVPVPTGGPVSGAVMKGLKVQGNKIVNQNGQQVRLIGVNRAGTEYSCVGGKSTDTLPWGFYEDHGDMQSFIAGLKTWNINTIRVPLNESCWNGIDSPDVRTMVPGDTTLRSEYLAKFKQYSGENYRAAIEKYVTDLTNAGFAVIVEIHWAAPGTFIARNQSPMLNRDNSVKAWTSIANRFKGNSAVVFDLHNEPFAWWNDVQPNSGAQYWECWKKGSLDSDPQNANRCYKMGDWYDNNGNAFLKPSGSKDDAPFKYKVAGMDELVAAVRSTGAQNIIMLGGLAYSNNLSRWLESKPADNNIAASWHVYNFNADCVTQQCWDTIMKPIVAAVPLVVGEVGMAAKDWEGKALPQDFLQKIIPFFDQNGIHYLAWTWNFWGCSEFQLISDLSGKVNTGCRNSEEIYAAMQNSIRMSQPSEPGVSPTAVPTVPPDCSRRTLGDANCDTKINLADFETLRRERTGSLSTKTADFNTDGTVNEVDYEIWLRNN